ncbi:hypothetical protein LUZ62_050248 [Rhynchospora pubera]|uniref:Glutamine amidotransferase domain-containing protein n=1 Tax=Rhynchospora pubera TaxID=906938 RepID=A0AAV8G6X0_9POAL|nr:hypothetical protein LUZ62_050248 [Rhynchospora pubera]
MNAITQRKHCLLLAANDSDYVKKVYGGYYNVFVKAFGEEGERWDCFRVVNGEFPPMDQLESYDGFVVSGSPNDAHGNDLWVLKLCVLLRILDCMKKKVLGICFGHQVLSRAHGGKVGKAKLGWDIGIRRVNFVNALETLKLFEPFQEEPHSASIIEVHQDEVRMVPRRAKVLAYSDHTRVEVFAIGNHILGFQGHPEYTKDILNNLVDRLVNNASITRKFGDEAKKRIDESEIDREFWLKICKTFLKQR